MIKETGEKLKRDTRKGTIPNMMIGIRRDMMKDPKDVQGTQTTPIEIENEPNFCIICLINFFEIN